MADVVGVLAALGLGCRECLAARLALGQSAEEIRAGRSAGMQALRCSRLQELGNLSKLSLRDEGWERPLDANRWRAVLGVDSPNSGTSIRLVADSGVHGALGPLLAFGTCHALGVENLGLVQRASWHYPGHPVMVATPTLSKGTFRQLARRLEPVPPALEGIARYRDSTPEFACKQAGKRDVQSGLVGLCHGSHEPFIGLR